MLYVSRKRSLYSRVAMLGVALGLTVVACAKPPAQTSSGNAAPIHPEAVVIDFYSGGKPTAACSGTLIASNLVLTAAHCADGSKAGVVHAPDAKGQTSTVEHVRKYDWRPDAPKLANDPRHDVAILVLKTPIDIKHYARIHKGSCAGCEVVHVAPAANGTSASSHFTLSAPTHLAKHSSNAHPFELATSTATSDAGGGMFRTTKGVPMLAGIMVSRGTSSGMGYAARLDDPSLEAWINRIATNARVVPAATAVPAATSHTSTVGVAKMHALDDNGDDTSGDDTSGDDTSGGSSDTWSPPVVDDGSGDSSGGGTTGDDTSSANGGSADNSNSNGGNGDDSSGNGGSTDNSNGGNADNSNGNGDPNGNGDEPTAPGGSPDGQNIDGTDDPRETLDQYDTEGSGIDVANPDREGMAIQQGDNYWIADNVDDPATESRDANTVQIAQNAADAGADLTVVATHGVNGDIDTLPPKEVVQNAAENGGQIYLSVCDSGQVGDDGQNLAGKLADEWDVPRENIISCTGTTGGDQDGNANCDGDWVDGNGDQITPSVPGVSFISHPPSNQNGQSNAGGQNGQ